MMAEVPKSSRWQKKKVGSARAEKMREAKRLKLLEADTAPSSDERIQEEQPGTLQADPGQGIVIDVADYDISLSQVQSQESQEDQVPPGEEKDFEEDPDGEEEEEESNILQDVFDDWMFSLTQDQRKMLSVLLYENFHNRQGMSVMNAANETASITGQFSVT